MTTAVPYTGRETAAPPLLSAGWLLALGAWLLFDSAYAEDLFLPLTAGDGQLKMAAGRGDGGPRPQERRVAIARDLLSSTRAQVEHGGAGALSLNVNADIRYDVLAEHTEPTKWGYSLSGRITGGTLGFVTLVVHDEAVAGHLWTPDRSYEIVPLGDGAHVVREVNESANIQCGTAMTAESPATVETSDDGADDGSVVDILVVWTPAAEARAGGENSMKARVDLAIAFTNDAFRRSGIFTALKLVGAEKVDYEEASNLPLDRLRDPKDGHLDDVLVLRDAVGADLVHLFTAGGGGVAYLGEAFAVSSNVLLFAHEIGHNFGVHHARDDLRISSYQHAFGDMAFGKGCATTITTNGGCGRFVRLSRTLPYYSSPALWDPRHGRPLGVSRFRPARVMDGPADAVLTINRRRHVVANFRPSRSDRGAANPSSLPSGDAGQRNARDATSALARTDSGDPNALVEIPDGNLRRAVERELRKASGDPITRHDMGSLFGVRVASLDEHGKGVRDLSGMEYAVNL